MTQAKHTFVFGYLALQLVTEAVVAVDWTEAVEKFRKKHKSECSGSDPMDHVQFAIRVCTMVEE